MDTFLKDNNDDASCGQACELLQDAFGSKPKTFSAYSKSDHTNMLSLVGSGGHPVHIRGDDVKPNIFLSFRGTYAWDTVNMRRNEQWGMIAISICDDCAAQRGVYKNFVSLRYSVLKLALEAEKYFLVNAPAWDSNPRHMVVGTSMGGQLAIFSGIYLRIRLSKNIIGTYTLGAPRTGNNALRMFARQVPSLNFANYRDPVPHLPFRSWGFASTANEIYWIYIDPTYYVEELSGGKPDYQKYMHYKVFNGFNADDAFARTLTYFTMDDHLAYFVGMPHESMFACGGFADHYLQNMVGTALFLA